MSSGRVGSTRDVWPQQVDKLGPGATFALDQKR